MVRLLRKIADWNKYERLHHYPELRAFDREGALRRLSKYEREERVAFQPWFGLCIAGNIFIAGMLCALFYIPAYAWMRPFTIIPMIPGWILQYFMYLKIRKRVAAKVAAELTGGRLKTCFECGYDLRETRGDVCTECGAPIVISEPKPS